MLDTDGSSTHSRPWGAADPAWCVWDVVETARELHGALWRLPPEF